MTSKKMDVDIDTVSFWYHTLQSSDAVEETCEEAQDALLLDEQELLLKVLNEPLNGPSGKPVVWATASAENRAYPINGLDNDQPPFPASKRGMIHR